MSRTRPATGTSETEFVWDSTQSCITPVSDSEFFMELSPAEMTESNTYRELMGCVNIPGNVKERPYGNNHEE